MLSYKRGIENYFKTCRKIPFRFSENTTYGLGGYADFAYVPQNIYQAKFAYDECVKDKANFAVVGNGSNILAADGRFDGRVISVRKLCGIFKVGKDKLFCLAGTPCSEILKYCRRNCLSGLEFMYGIPATIGGAAYMNAGAGGSYMQSCILGVLLYDGRTRYFDNNKCNFEYKHSTMRDINSLILAVVVKVYNSSPEEIEEKISIFKERRKHLPTGRSCGCVFKNPPNLSAGMLIEHCGLKGICVGGAKVSSVHANFILSSGGLSSDVFALISLVKDSVFKKFGILLEEEVIYIGDFNESYG